MSSGIRQRFLIQLAALLAISGAAALAYEMIDDNNALNEAILGRARAHFEDMIVARRWNAEYGGVYVEKRPGVTASPHLENPDIETRDGKTYTLRNPALMAREMSEIAARSGDLRFRMSSLKPANTENKADDWERGALEAFAGGEKERFEILQIGERSEVRYMAPLFIEKPCLKCHADQGYVIGDVRGGIAVRFDVTALLAQERQRNVRTALTILAILAGVLLLVHTYVRNLDRRMQKLSRRHEDLIHSVDGIVWEADAKTFQFTFVSDKAERLLGFPASEWMQPGFWVEHLHPDDRSWAPEYCASCTQRLEAHDFTYRFIARDGRTVWLRDIVSVVSEHGEPSFLRGLMFDVTKQTKLDELKNDLLTKQETILSNALVGIVHLKNRRVMYCNRRFEKLLGYDPGELIGQSTEIFYESRQAWEEVGQRAYATLATGATFSVEMHLRRKNGGLFWGAINGSAIDPEHPQEGSIWVYVDVNDRRAAEDEVHKLMLAIEQSPVSIVITNRDGNIEYVNPRFTRVTGYTAREVKGQNPRVLQSGETPRQTYVDLWNTLLCGREWRGILRNRRKNGELFWEEASISPIVDAFGTITHFIAVKEDISERKRIEEELERYQSHLEELVDKRTADLAAALDAAKIADRTKDVFLANVSHELRTPLNAVIGLSELAMRNATDPRQHDALEKISDAGQTLLGIINDLLDLTKITAGEMCFEATTFSLRRIVARVRSVMAHRAAEKGLNLYDEIDDDVPDVLVGDPLRIEQVMLNLVNNAVKFTHAGQVTMKIHALTTNDTRADLRLEIEDSGIGMTEEEIARLFQPFVQADASISRRFGGTGLGLTICKQLAEGMGGSIEVSSVETHGTTFTVRLPLLIGRLEDLPANDVNAASTSAMVSYADARVLIVDDQPLNREIVFDMLGQVNVIPRTASNGREAVELIVAEGPGAFDLVLMDIQMPILDGLSATREIRGRSGFAELPIVAMTAHTMVHEKEKYLAAGMDDHIGKPFKLSEFYALLAKWLSARATPGTLPAYNLTDASGDDPFPRIPGLDSREAIGRFSNNIRRYRHWLAVFVEESENFSATLATLIDSGDCEAARKSLHAFKGRIGVLGMMEMRALVETVEQSLDDKGQADLLLAELSGAIRAMRSKLSETLDLASAPDDPGDFEEAFDEPMPAKIAALITMLEAGDGQCAGYIETLIGEMPERPWLPLLRRALEEVRRFEFEAARQLLQRPEFEDA